ncbi:MAG: ABC transporter ATP-binding protein/permease [Mollicutes bacterium]|nr:ABC transporter ATP-binding protein/permease [Mollicutes bacterium]
MKVLKIIGDLKKYIFIMIVFSITQVFCELYLPNIMSNIVDIGIANADKAFIIKEAIIMFITTIVCLISHILVIYSTAKFSNNYGYKIRKALYSKITSFSKKEIDEFGASTLITRSTNNVSNITSTFSFGLRLIIFAPIMGIGAAIMGYKTAPSLAPIVLVAVCILVIGLSTIFVLVFPKFEVLQKLLDKLNASTREILSGLRVIKAFNKQKFFKKRFDKVNTENKNLNIFLNKVLYLVEPMMSLIINIATIVIVYVSCDYLSLGTLEIGSMMAFIQYMSTVLLSFMMLLVIILNIPRVIVSFKRINEVLSVEPSISNTGKIKLSNLESIEFKNVYFRYDKAQEDMLKNISFRIEKGENIGIIGSSGSGKTTIVNLLLRHIDPTSGNILINGIDIKEYDIESLRNIFAYTPQKTLLFKGSIRENLTFDKNFANNVLDNALDEAAIKDFIDNNTEGYEFKIEQSAVNLSGGQKQRMSIARALLSGGECLLFDDSFSAVDYITDKKIRNSINNNYSDKMVILVTQRVGTIKDADKIIVIDEGKVESIGNYDTLEKTSKVFKEFVDSQKREVA